VRAGRRDKAGSVKERLSRVHYSRDLANPPKVVFTTVVGAYSRIHNKVCSDCQASCVIEGSGRY
jgi:hypothetical protein